MNGTIDYQRDVEDVRASLRAAVAAATALKIHPRFDQPLAPGQNSGEAKANLALAVRHLEDAQHRLGRASMAMSEQPPLPPELTNQLLVTPTPPLPPELVAPTPVAPSISQ